VLVLCLLCVVAALWLWRIPSPKPVHENEMASPPKTESTASQEGKARAISLLEGAERHSSSGVNLGNIAVVNVKRLLVAHPPGENTPAARAENGAEIQRVVNEVAREKGFALVLDRSGFSDNQMQVVLTAPHLPDLTEEVLQRLTPP